MATSPKKMAENVWLAIKHAFVLGVTVLVWVAAVILARWGYDALPKPLPPGIELTTILFGASSIALFILSILLAVVAVYGWGTIKTTVKEQVVEVTKERLEKVENELRGRSFGVLGYLMGESSIDANDLSKATDEIRLRQAFHLCEQSYQHLKGTELSTEYMTLNNMLSYACILKENKRSLLIEAKKLKVAAEAHDAYNLLLTYSRTVLEFSTVKADIQEARSIYTEIVKSGVALNSKQISEIKILDALYQGRAQQYLA